MQPLGDRLHEYWERYGVCFQTQTRDGRAYAYDYLSGQLRMEAGRNYTNIARQTGNSEQNMQHFMTNSPWSVQGMDEQMAGEIGSTGDLRSGGVVS